MEIPRSKWPLMVALGIISLLIFGLLPWYLASLERVAHAKLAKKNAIQTADLKMLESMAEKGDAMAQFKLGEIFLKGGENQVRDYSEAFKWFTLASEHGSKAAAVSLEQLIPIMTPEQIAEGRQRVEKFAALWQR